MSRATRRSRARTHTMHTICAASAQAAAGDRNGPKATNTSRAPSRHLAAHGETDAGAAWDLLAHEEEEHVDRLGDAAALLRRCRDTHTHRQKPRDSDRPMTREGRRTRRKQTLTRRSTEETGDGRDGRRKRRATLRQSRLGADETGDARDGRRCGSLQFVHPFARTHRIWSRVVY